jgi:hypothetical protein
VMATLSRKSASCFCVTETTEFIGECASLTG